MRLVIDLQFCQNADTPQSRAILALVQQLARSAGEHELWIALSSQYPERLAKLRAAFTGWLPSPRIRTYETPPRDGTERMDHTISLIRNHFFATLGADLVFIPHMYETGHDPVGAIGSIEEDPWHHPVAITVGPALLPASSNKVSVLPDDLRNAALLVAFTEEARQSVMEHTGKDVILLEEEVVVAAERLWSTFDAIVARQPRTQLAGERPRLAYFSPLPPQQSGIADYSAELIVELARYYQIELITDPALTLDSGITSTFSVRSLDWFEEHANQFDRIIYHIGNSDVHRHMFGMLERYPGIVVLHDFFLGNIIHHLEHAAKIPHAFKRALFHSHGYTGLRDCLRIGLEQAVWKYPANKAVLDCASGVIVHSEYPAHLAETWYGSGSSTNWHTVPLLRADIANPDGSRATARARLDFADDDFLICSFGMLGRTKLNHQLLDAFISLPRTVRDRCHLIFVGGLDPTDYGKQLQQRISASGLHKQITVTGFIDAADYRRYLSVCDAAVQLRTSTRGESSASVLDCLLHGIPTIVNAHGANVTLPDSVLIKLPDQFETEELCNSLLHLYEAPGIRASLGRAARQFVQNEHNPERVARLYVDAIEDITHNSQATHYRKLLQEMARRDTPTDPRHHELLAAATSISLNQPPGCPQQIFIDVSALALTDLKTGIQRVVRSIMLALINSPPHGYRIEPVYHRSGHNDVNCYRYARRFTLDLIGDKGFGLEDAPIECRPGDIFLGLDLYTGGTTRSAMLLRQMRNLGVSVYFVVYDLLPLLQPQMFPFGTDTDFQQYVETIVTESDGVVCISRAVADEVTKWVTDHPPKRNTDLKIGYFHLGADIDASAPTTGLPEKAEQIFAAVRKCPTLLMVGTVEPRKGHAQALDAFDELWARGIEVNLVIVGKEGWLVESFVKRIRRHPQLDKRLFWLYGVSDEMLLSLYANCSALLAASVGEGFGLPLIEAAQHKLPIIARRLPVFMEVSGEHAFYFDALDGKQIADAIQQWLELFHQGKAPPSTGMPWLTWVESAQQLLDSVIAKRWYRELPAPASW